MTGRRSLLPGWARTIRPRHLRRRFLERSLQIRRRFFAPDPSASRDVDALLRNCGWITTAQLNDYLRPSDGEASEQTDPSGRPQGKRGPA